MSEMPPGFTGHRWCFPARNRIIAALSTITIVVEAATRSGSLITADLATDLGRVVAAVPGPVTSRYSAGANELLHAGAAVIRGARDVLDLVLGADAPTLPEPAPLVPLDPAQRRVLDAIERGAGHARRAGEHDGRGPGRVPDPVGARAARARPARVRRAVRAVLVTRRTSEAAG